MSFKLSREQAQFIFNVLAKYPYGEVAEAINVLRSGEQKAGNGALELLNENNSPKTQ